MKKFEFFLLIYIPQILGILFHLEVLSLVFVFLFAICMCMVCNEKDEPSLIKFLIFEIAFQNIFIGFFAHLFSNESSNLSYLTQAPTVVCYVITIYILFKKKLDKIDFMGALLVILLFISLALHISSGSITGKLNYFRNYSIFYCFFTIGRWYGNKKETRESIIKFTEKYAVILSIIGIVFMFCPFEFFEILGINELYIAKGAPLDGDFVGRFTTTLYKTQLKRIGSIMFEPINFGYFLIVPFLTLYSKLKTKNINVWLSFIVVSLGLITTFAKGAYIVCAFSIIIDAVRKNMDKLKVKSSFKKKKKSHFMTLTIFSIAIIAIFSIWYYKNIGAAANTHFWAIEQTFVNTLKKPIFGYGLGTGGNYGSQENGWLSTGGESGMMGLIYQMGYPFFIIFALIFISISHENIKKEKNFTLAYLPIILLVVSIFQENTFSPQCIGVAMLIAGEIYGIKKMDKNEDYQFNELDYDIIKNGSKI